MQLKRMHYEPETYRREPQTVDPPPRSRLTQALPFVFLGGTLFLAAVGWWWKSDSDAAYEAALGQEQQQNSERELELKNAGIELDLRNKALEKSSKDLVELNDAMTTLRRKGQQATAEQEARFIAATQKLEAAERGQAEAQAKLEARVEENKGLLAENTALKEQVDKALKEGNRLKAEIVRLKELISQLEKENRELQTDLLIANAKEQFCDGKKFQGNRDDCREAVARSKPAVKARIEKCADAHLKIGAEDPFWTYDVPGAVDLGGQGFLLICDPTLPEAGTVAEAGTD